MNTNDLPPLALIAGPTASGKTALALALAETAGGTIVNADASQVYRDLRILSARPSPAEEARAPHRLFGYLDASEVCSAARWAADARLAIAAVHADGGLPILVGGTGLYLRTLLDGIAPVPAIDPLAREAVRAMPVAEAYARLAELDPAAATRLPAADASRVARALEVVLATGRPLAAWQAGRAGGIGGSIRLAALVLDPPRAWIDARIARRLDAMVAGGVLDEVERLLARDLPAALPAMRAIGVAEFAGVLAGRSPLADALAAVALATRRYAKRQRTWFAHQPPASWDRLRTQLDDAQKVKDATRLLIERLTRSSLSL